MKAKKEILWGIYHRRDGFDYHFNSLESHAENRLLYVQEKGWEVVQVEIREIKPKRRVKK